MTPKRNSKSGKKGSPGKKTGRKGDKKRTHKTQDSFATYIFKVLKQVHPDTGISSKAMSIVNSFSHDLLDRLARTAGGLARYQKRRTIIQKDALHAVNLVIPGELKKHSVSEATKAIHKYNADKS